jgi:aminotransferase
MASSDAEWWGVDIDVPGRRFLMNDLNAAIGLEQLKKLPKFIARRHEVDDRYRMLLGGRKDLLLPPPVAKDNASSYYLFWVQLESEEIRTGLANYLRQNGVYTTFRYYPLHWVRYYKDKYPQPILPGAEWAAHRTLCLPIHQALEDSDVDRVCELIIGFLRNRE